MEKTNNVSATMEQKNNIPATMEQKDYVVRFEVITPERARQILNENPLNRKAKDFGVKFLIKQMERGEWNPSPTEPIALASDGTLLDGQHRLIACIESGMSLPMYIMYNVPKNCKETIDTGITRSGADVLTMAGIPNANGVAATVLEYLSLKNMGYDGKGAKYVLVSNKNILDEYLASEELFQSLWRLAYSTYKKGRYLNPKQIGGISAFLIKEKGHTMEEVSGFFLELAVGGAHEYMGWLRNHLNLSRNVNNRAYRLSSRERLILVSKAWNTYITGKNAHAFQIRKEDSITFI